MAISDSSWVSAKTIGDDGEQRAARALLRAFPHVASVDWIQTDLESQRTGDLAAARFDGGVLLVEVKADALANVTGNLAIELARRVGVGLAGTGLSTSEADVWAFVLSRRVVFVRPDELRRLLDERRASASLREVWGGDGKRTRLALVPIVDVLGLAGVVVVDDAEGTR
jgi:hypothetical protein